MNCHALVKLLAGDRAALVVRRMAAYWFQLVVVGWLGASLALSGPGMAVLVATTPCEADAPEESERAAADVSFAASQPRRLQLRQILVRHTFAVELAPTRQRSVGIHEPRRSSLRFSSDVQLGTGCPMRC